jgi:branched-chain amino acid transport system substrate-binding protein
MKTKSILVLALLSTVLACEKDKPVKFGAVLPLTGEAAVYGVPIRKGVELAVDQIRMLDDYPYELELVVVDSESDPEKGRQLLAELYSQGALAVIGGVTTAEALAMVAEADEHDQVLMSPSASTPELTGISKNFYRVFPSDAREGATMGNFATQKLNAEKVVVLSKESAYAKGIQEIFEREFERHGGEVLESIEFPSLSSDLSGVVERVMTLNPDAVYLAAYAEVIARVGRPAEGVFLTQAAFDPNSEEPEVKTFVDGYRAKYQSEPDLYAVHGYDAMMVLAEALRQSGDLPTEFWKGVRSIRDFTGATGTIQFDERGDVQKFPRVYVVNNGQLIDYEAEVERRRQELLDRLRRLEEEQRKTRAETGG